MIFRELRQTRFYQEIWEEGYEEGHQEVRDEILPRIVPTLLASGLTAEEIAARLQMDIETIQRAAQSSGHNEGIL